MNKTTIYKISKDELVEILNRKYNKEWIKEQVDLNGDILNEAVTINELEEEQ